MNYKSCLVTFLIVCLNAAYTEHGSDSNDFDLLIFTQAWPETVCKVWTHNKPSHTCAFPHKRDTWTIHGVWPTKKGTMGPAFCNKTWLFDPEQVKPIEDELEQVWKNVEKQTNLYDLWTHEWNKHGTCAAVLEPFNSELKYFTTGINLRKKYLMTDILTAAGIIPSDTQKYPVNQIYDVVQKSIGKNPMIECVFEDHVQYLKEVRVCLSKTLDLVDCDDVLSLQMKTNCNQAHGIIYPHYEDEESSPQHQYVQLYKFVNWLQWYTL